MNPRTGGGGAISETTVRILILYYRVKTMEKQIEDIVYTYNNINNDNITLRLVCRTIKYFIVDHILLYIYI